MKKAFEEDSLRLGKTIVVLDSELWKRWIITEAIQKISDDRIEYILSVISEVIYFRWKNNIQEKICMNGMKMSLR